MIYDIIIIGGGPAGITAGIYCVRQKMSLLLITKEFGGQMARKTVEIENYTGFPKISGLDLIKKFKEHMDDKGVKVEMGEVVKVEKNKDIFSVFTKEGKEFQSKTIIVATGAKPKELNVLGEKEFIGKGVSYCPMCDGPLFREKKVAVIGGGDAGFETAIWLSKFAKEITILEFDKKLSGAKQNQDTAEKTGKVKVITEAEIKEIKGDNFVNAVVYNNPEEKILNVDGVFIEIGYSPASDFVKKFVDLTDKGEIKIDRETGETKTKGLYAAGDVNRGKCRQIIVACGEGAVAANAIYKYLQNIKQ